MAVAKGAATSTGRQDSTPDGRSEPVQRFAVARFRQEEKGYRGVPRESANAEEARGLIDSEERVAAPEHSAMARLGGRDRGRRSVPERRPDDTRDALRVVGHLQGPKGSASQAGGEPEQGQECAQSEEDDDDLCLSD